MLQSNDELNGPIKKGRIRSRIEVDIPVDIINDNERVRKVEDGLIRSDETVFTSKVFHLGSIKLISKLNSLNLLPIFILSMGTGGTIHESKCFSSPMDSGIE
jgi:hypothetical protein